MKHNISVLLECYLKNFVDLKVSTGKFKNTSEVIIAGLRLLEEEDTKIEALRTAITAGMESGLARNFDAKKHLKKLKTDRRKKNGQVLRDAKLVRSSH